MEKQKKFGKILRSILEVMLVSVFVFFLIGEAVLPEENEAEAGGCSLFSAEWVRVYGDGTKVPIAVPGECVAERGELVTIETTLPDEQQDTWLCIRSMQQDMKIYVDGSLRKEYSTVDTQPFGKTSTIAYVFIEINEEDAGKVLTIEAASDSAYAGYISEILEGDKADIWRHFLKLYGVSAILALFMVIVGLVVVGYSWVIKYVYKKDVELLHLGNGILIASSWLLAESRLRQFILPNSTVAMYLGFYLIILIPYPLATYINNIQNNRYWKAYTTILVCTGINFVLATVLQVFGIKDFFETMGISHAIIIALVFIIIGTIVLDIRKKYISEYKEVALGLIGLTVGGVMEICMVYTNSSRYNGVGLCLGVMLLLFMAAMKTSRDIMDSEQEKQIAIAASESKAKFLANMSHEIRTPINTVIGMNEMILRENKDENINEYARNIKGASQMLLGLINDILDISKIEAGKLIITESDYQVASMLHDVILGVEGRAQQKNLELKLEIDETLPAVLRGDEIRIKQVLNNLLSNAVKYTEKGSIIFSVRGLRDVNGFVLELSVADTGIGIRKEDMEKLFESFTRLELKKNRYIQGTGLGLSITKQLLDLMNGELGVTSEYGVGSCFTVRIPQQIVDETAMGDMSKRYVERDAGEPGEQMILHAPDARILVVDDNKMNLKVIKELLKRTEIRLDFATGGNQCLQMTAKKKYDLILMDHMMPEPDGVQTLHMLRESEDNLNRDTKVIVLTANAIEGVAKEYLKEGFVDYLSKPVEPVKLENVIAKYLS